MLLDWYDGTTDTQLQVSMENCLFIGNQYAGMGSNTALIYANSNQNVLDIRKTVFEDNDMNHNNTIVRATKLV